MVSHNLTIPLSALYVWHRHLMFLNCHWSGMIFKHDITVLLCFLFEYCCLSCVCKPFKSKAIGLSDSYQNLASPTKVKQNLLTFTASGNAWVSIQSFVLKRWASASSPGFPAHSSLKWDQFNCGTGSAFSGWEAGCTGGTASYVGGVGCCAGGGEGIVGGAGAEGGGCGIGGPLSAIFLYVLSRNVYVSEKDCLGLYLTKL